jgi:hypothetical protein
MKNSYVNSSALTICYILFPISYFHGKITKNVPPVEKKAQEPYILYIFMLSALHIVKIIVLHL